MAYSDKESYGMIIWNQCLFTTYNRGKLVGWNRGDKVFKYKCDDTVISLIIWNDWLVARTANFIHVFSFDGKLLAKLDQPGGQGPNQTTVFRNKLVAISKNSSELKFWSGNFTCTSTEVPGAPTEVLRVITWNDRLVCALAKGDVVILDEKEKGKHKKPTKKFHFPSKQ